MAVTSKAFADAENDWAGNFLNSGVAIGLDATSNIAASAIAPAGAVVNSVAQYVALASLTAELSQQAVSYIGQEVTSYATDKISQMLSINMSKLLSEANSQMSTYLMGAKDIWNMLNAEGETDYEKNEKAVLEKEQKEALKKIQEQVGEIKSKIDDKLSKVTDAINSITTYAYKGEDWCNNEVKKFEDDTIADCKNYLAKMTENVENKKNEMIKNWAAQIASQNAGKINNELTIATKEKLDKVKQQVARVKLIKAILINKAILLLKGLLGG